MDHSNNNKANAKLNKRLEIEEIRWEKFDEKTKKKVE